MNKIWSHTGDEQTGGGEAGREHDMAHRQAAGRENSMDWIMTLLPRIVVTDRKCEKRGHEEWDIFIR